MLITALGSLSRGRFLFCVSHYGFTGDQRAKAFGGDDGAAANARDAQTPSCNVIVERRPAKAGRLTGLSDAIAQLLGGTFQRLHWITSV